MVFNSQRPFKVRRVSSHQQPWLLADAQLITLYLLFNNVCFILRKSITITFPSLAGKLGPERMSHY